MRIKLDENMPAGLVQVLLKLGHHVDTVPQEGLTSASDDLIWQAAQDSQRFLITQDLDFSDVRRFAPGTHHGVLLVRLRQPSRQTLTKKVKTIFENEQVETWIGGFTVATQHKIRVRRSS